MALVFADLVRETTSTTGTGTLTLTGAVTNYQSFAVIGNANTTYYRIISGADSEVGIGTYMVSGTTLSRDTVLYSSAGGTTKITVAVGATVICTYPAEKVVILDASGNATALGTPAAFVATNVTGLPISTGVSGLATGVATFLATPSSANLATALTDETGTGACVFATSPTFVTPILGTPTSGNLSNCTGIPAGGITGTLPVANGGTGLTTFTAANNALYSTSAGALAAGTLPVLAGGTGVTTSTGSGAVVLSTTPTLVTPVIGAATGTSLVVTAAVTGAAIIASNGMIVNNATVSTSYTLPTGYNASSVGPLTINSGVVVTVPSTQKWVVL